MQIIFLPKFSAVLLCFILWFIFQVTAAFICRNLPDHFFHYSSFFYRAHNWEKNGKVYQTWFKVKIWKKYLPDGGSLGRDGFRKKKITQFSKDNLERFLLESCRGEMIHWLAILPFWVFGFFAPMEVVIIMLFYALSVNLPCVIAQRYNRPRIVKIIKKKE